MLSITTLWHRSIYVSVSARDASLIVQCNTILFFQKSLILQMTKFTQSLIYSYNYVRAIFNQITDPLLHFLWTQSKILSRSRTQIKNIIKKTFSESRTQKITFSANSSRHNQITEYSRKEFFSVEISHQYFPIWAETTAASNVFEKWPRSASCSARMHIIWSRNSQTNPIWYSISSTMERTKNRFSRSC